MKDFKIKTWSMTGNIEIFYSVKDAFEHYKKDKRVWKISFLGSEGAEEHWRPKTKSERCQNEDVLKSKSAEYLQETNYHKIFWIMQSKDAPSDVVDYTKEKKLCGLLTDVEVNSDM